MDQWQRELEEVKTLYESYRKILPAEAMAATDAYVKRWDPRSLHIDLYHKLILCLEHHYYFVLNSQTRSELDLVRSLQSISI